MGKGQGNNHESGYIRVHGVLKGAMPQFSSLCLDGDDDFVSCTIRHRAAGDYVAVIKALDGDGGPVVCFGNGFDLVSALLGIEGTLAADRWQADKPFKAG